MIATLGLERPIGVREPALLLVGFGAALRRSELVALDVAETPDDRARQLWVRSVQCCYESARRGNFTADRAA